MTPRHVCPICSAARLRVYRTRQTRGGITYRYRRCQCGAKTVTRERHIVEPIGEPRVIPPPPTGLF